MLLFMLTLILFLYLFLIKRKWGYSKVDFSMKNSSGKYLRKGGLYYEVITPINKKIAREGLGIIHEVMEKYKVFFWLSDGTALGFVRNNDIIDYDDDVDINIRKEDKYIVINSVIPELQNRGFRIGIGLNNFMGLVYKGVDYDIDIVGEGIVSSSNFMDCKYIMKYLEVLDAITIDGRVYNIPTRHYLEYLYGPTWTIPIKRYKPHMDKRELFKQIIDNID